LHVWKEKVININNFNLSSNGLLKKVAKFDISENDLASIESYLSGNQDFENKLIKIIKDVFANPANKNLPGSFYRIFGFFKSNVIKDIFSYFIDKKISTDILSDMLENNGNIGLVYAVLEIFFDNASKYLSDTSGFVKFIGKNIPLTPSYDRNMVRHFLLNLAIPSFLNDENIKNLMKLEMPGLITKFRKNIFSLSKSLAVNIANHLYNDHDNLEKLPEYKDEIGKFLDFDLWTFTDTYEELSSCINGLVDSGNYDDTQVFYRINEISNMAFKNFDVKSAVFAELIVNLSDKVFSTSLKDDAVEKECELLINGVDVFEKGVIKDLLKRINRIKGILSRKDDTVKNLILCLLIDDDLKAVDMKKDKKSENSDLNPLDDTDLVYNPKNEIHLSFDDRKYLIKKSSEDGKEFFILSAHEDVAQADVKCENEDAVKKELEKIGFDYISVDNLMNKIRTLMTDQIRKDENPLHDNMLDAAVEVVNEVKSGFEENEIEDKKNDIVEIAGEVLEDRKNIQNSDISRKIILSAIDISLKEKDFEDL
jgi:hypothetical protein